MKTSDIKRLGEAWASVTSKEEIEEAKTDKQEDKGQFIAAAKAAKKNGEKTFTIGGKEYDVEEALDPVNDKENDKKFKDRKDKDIDNDGDVDSSDEYLHKRRAATDDAIDGGKKPAKNAKKEQDEPEEEEDDENKSDTANGNGEKKKEKKNGNPKTADKTAEISKIGEAVDELNSMFERLWEAEQSGKRKQDQTNGEPYDDKESPKSKEFANAHKKSDKKIEDDEEDGHDKTFKAGQATKAKSGKRPQDNQAGDNKVVNPVKEDVDMNAKDGSVSLVDMARAQLAGEMKQHSKDDDGKNPFDGRTKAAKEFLERMNKKHMKKDK